jgi:hypothetical protein
MCGRPKACSGMPSIVVGDHAIAFVELTDKVTFGIFDLATKQFRKLEWQIGPGVPMPSGRLFTTGPSTLVTAITDLDSGALIGARYIDITTSSYVDRNVRGLYGGNFPALMQEYAAMAADGYLEIGDGGDTVDGVHRLRDLSPDDETVYIRTPPDVRAKIFRWRGAVAKGWDDTHGYFSAKSANDGYGSVIGVYNTADTTWDWATSQPQEGFIALGTSSAGF